MKQFRDLFRPVPLKKKRANEVANVADGTKKMSEKEEADEFAKIEETRR
jgi:hypothetical protein